MVGLVLEQEVRGVLAGAAVTVIVTVTVIVIVVLAVFSGGASATHLGTKVGEGPCLPDYRATIRGIPPHPRAIPLVVVSVPHRGIVGARVDVAPSASIGTMLANFLPLPRERAAVFLPGHPGAIPARIISEGKVGIVKTIRLWIGNGIGIGIGIGNGNHGRKEHQAIQNGKKAQGEEIVTGLGNHCWCGALLLDTSSSVVVVV